MIAYLLLEWREWLERDLSRDGLIWAVALFVLPLFFSYQPVVTGILIVCLSLFQGWSRGALYHQESERRKRLFLPSASSASPGSAVAASSVAAFLSWAAAASLSLPHLILMGRLWSLSPATAFGIVLLGGISLLISFGLSFLYTLTTGMGADRSVGSAGLLILSSLFIPGLFWKPLSWTSPLALALAEAGPGKADPRGMLFLTGSALLLLCLSALVLRGRRRTYHGD